MGGNFDAEQKYQLKNLIGNIQQSHYQPQASWLGKRDAEKEAIFSHVKQIFSEIFLETREAIVTQVLTINENRDRSVDWFANQLCLSTLTDEQLYCLHEVFTQIGRSSEVFSPTFVWPEDSTPQAQGKVKEARVKNIQDTLKLLVNTLGVSDTEIANRLGTHGQSRDEVAKLVILDKFFERRGRGHAVMRRNVALAFQLEWEERMGVSPFQLEQLQYLVTYDKKLPHRHSLQTIIEQLFDSPIFKFSTLPLNNLSKRNIFDTVHLVILARPWMKAEESVAFAKSDKPDHDDVSANLHHIDNWIATTHGSFTEVIDKLGGLAQLVENKKKREYFKNYKKSVRALIKEQNKRLNLLVSRLDPDAEIQQDIQNRHEQLRTFQCFAESVFAQARPYLKAQQGGSQVLPVPFIDIESETEAEKSWRQEKARSDEERDHVMRARKTNSTKVSKRDLDRTMIQRKFSEQTKANLWQALKDSSVFKALLAHQKAHQRQYGAGHDEIGREKNKTAIITHWIQQLEAAITTQHHNRVLDFLDSNYRLNDDVKLGPPVIKIEAGEDYDDKGRPSLWVNTGHGGSGCVQWKSTTRKLTENIRKKYIQLQAQSVLPFTARQSPKRLRSNMLSWFHSSHKRKPAFDPENLAAKARQRQGAISVNEIIKAKKSLKATTYKLR